MYRAWTDSECVTHSVFSQGDISARIPWCVSTARLPYHVGLEIRTASFRAIPITCIVCATKADHEDL